MRGADGKAWRDKNPGVAEGETEIVKSGLGENVTNALRSLPAVTALLLPDNNSTKKQSAKQAAKHPDKQAAQQPARQATSAPTRPFDNQSVNPNQPDYWDAFDLILTPDDLVSFPNSLDILSESISNSPQASTALVQLLRAGENLNMRDALIAESWVYSMLQSGSEFLQWLATRKTHTQEPDHFKTPPVITNETGNTLQILLNRPHKRNAFNTAMRDSLAQILRATRLALPPGGIFLSGQGEAFCAGGDLSEFGTTPDPATAHTIRSQRNVAWEIHQLSEFITAKLHGACVGAGIELAAFAGKVIAHEDTFFQLPELKLGLVPGSGGTASIPRRIGRHRTAWLALSGQKLDTSTALRWGLIDQISSG